MPPVNIFKFGVSSPADSTPLQELAKAGYSASQVIGLVGKTEGNGCVNDFSRSLSAMVWEPLLPQDSVTVFSGGTEGVLSPHVTFLVQEHGEANTGLLATVGRTRKFEPHEIGTADQAREVAKTVSQMVKELESSKDSVHLVLIKCPLLTTKKVQDIYAAGRTPVTTDTYKSMAKSRYACAVGIAVALEEIEESSLEDAMTYQSIWSAVASCSAGAELEDCRILVLASSPVPGPLKATSTFMEDSIDARAILEVLGEVNQDRGEVLQVFAKAEADPSGEIRGRRHTMNTDSDLHSTRHARAAVGGLIAGLTSDTQIYVSGGAEGQGPPGGGSLCMIYSCPI
ncbi:ring-opening amidohydrolase [Xylariales sp. AK1849]|nr:ring-opening amidohydrolase [Xylariales sp. AK1849]